MAEGLTAQRIHQDIGGTASGIGYDSVRLFIQRFVVARCRSGEWNALKVFEEMERPALLPLPPERFPNFHEAKRKINRDGHIEVAIAITGKSYRLRNKDATLPVDAADPKPANLPTGSQAKKKAKSQRDNSSEEAA